MAEYSSADAESAFRTAQELATAENVQEAFAYYKKAAEMGHAPAAFIVSQYHYAGVAGVAEDADLSSMWALIAYIDHFPQARSWLDTIYGKGKFPPAEKIFETAKNNAEAGSAGAMFLCGMCYEMGIGTFPDGKAAYEMFSRSSENGNLDGTAQLALCLIRGAGCQRDREKGISLLKETADRNHLRACLKYAWCLEHGWTGKKDRLGAYEAYRKICDRKVPIGRYEVGRCFMDGIGVKESIDDAASWYIVARKEGCPEAEFGISRCTLAGKMPEKPTEGLKMLTACAEEGSPDAMFMLAQLYSKDGRLVKKDEKAAAEWYRKAAVAGRTSAMVITGDNCYRGRNTKKNGAEAYRFYLMAALQGNTEGMHMAGNALIEGSGVDKDEAEGFRLCSMAAEDGFRKAQYVVAACYAEGRGTEKDLSKAVALHKALAEGGYIKSMLFIGEALYHGRGTEKNPEEAVKWFEKGAAEGSMQCMYYLGDAYDHGLGVEQDEEKAKEWYEKAAEKGHHISRRILDAKEGIEPADEAVPDESPFNMFLKNAEAGDAQSMYIIGRYYESGIGMNADIETARMWYQKAAEKGNAAAQRSLESLDKEGKPPEAGNTTVQAPQGPSVAEEEHHAEDNDTAAQAPSEEPDVKEEPPAENNDTAAQAPSEEPDVKEEPPSEKTEE